MRQLSKRSRRDIRENDVWFAIDLRWVESWIRFTSFHMANAQMADYDESENCHPRPMGRCRCLGNLQAKAGD